jgi:hypothetical protein
LKATKNNHGLIFKPIDGKEVKIDCCVDADFAGIWGHEDDQYPPCVQRRMGFVIFIQGCFGCLPIKISRRCRHINDGRKEVQYSKHEHARGATSQNLTNFARDSIGITRNRTDIVQSNGSQRKGTKSGVQDNPTQTRGTQETSKNGTGSIRFEIPLVQDEIETK